jgi:hypothetical protein
MFQITLKRDEEMRKNCFIWVQARSSSKIGYEH